MKGTTKPQQELSKAKRHLEAMKESSETQVLEENWLNFLHSIERVWNKIEYHYGKSPRWNGWKGKYVALRKKDQLLSYLTNSRGCDEHTGEDVVRIIPPSLTINPIWEGGPLFLNEIRISPEEFYIDAPDAVIGFLPAEMEIKEVTNRGRTYHPPATHLGRVLPSRKVIDLAELAVSFYQNVIDETELFFVK